MERHKGALPVWITSGAALARIVTCGAEATQFPAIASIGPQKRVTLYEYLMNAAVRSRLLHNVPSGGSNWIIEPKDSSP